MTILFVHLLNNFTGSPRVLANFLNEFATDASNEIHLLTSKSDGCLSDFKNVKYHWNSYKWISNKIVLSFILLFSQIYQFLFVLFGKKYDCVYINTILPFGAAFAARIRKEKIIYHIHEYYPRPNFMQKVCVFFAKKCAGEIIFVSDYLRNCYKDIFTQKEHIIHNSVSSKFHESAEKIIKNENYLQNKFSEKQVVLPCSLKKYKGVFLFVEIAKKLPEYNFVLVTSNSKVESDEFFKNYDLPKNFEIKNEIRNMSKIYSSASVVMNLSIPHGIDRIIETFSMILIESFEFKTPCIAPCYGGPLEIIENEKNGFLLEIENLEDVSKNLNFILSDFNLYKEFCENAYIRSKYFSTSKFVKKINNIIQESL